MKTIEIPEGAKSIKITEENNRVVIEFEPEYKDGDTLTTVAGNIFIFKRYSGDCVSSYCFLHKSIHSVGFHDRPACTVSEIKGYATESEKQRLFDALAKDGKRWNPEKKCIEELRWRAENFQGYFYINRKMGITAAVETKSPFDNNMYEIGNYFRTIEEAEAMRDKLMELLNKG